MQDKPYPLQELDNVQSKTVNITQQEFLHVFKLHFHEVWGTPASWRLGRQGSCMT